MNTSDSSSSRRSFLRQACCAAVGTTGLLSALSQLRVMAAVAGDGLPSRAAAVAPDYKALVCLFLQGGYDGSSLIVPSDASSYAAYASARAEVAVAQAGLLPITPQRYADGRSYAFNPAARELQGLFAQGKLACLANVGTLVRPTTLAEYRSGANLPSQLFSHLDQLQQWQSSVPNPPFETGWGGRLADLTDALNSNNQVSMSVSLNGANTFQRGKTVGTYAMNTGGAAVLNSTGGGTGGVYTATTNGLKAIMNLPQANLLAGTFGKVTAEALADGEVMNAAVRGAPTLRTVFPGSQTALRLAMVAKVISVSQALGLRRQVFFVQLGGWDMHGAQANAFGPLLSEVSVAMKAFYDATVELGVANQVTTFTASDFGRSYVPNAGGTDHGWGNHHLIMGGAVKGGDIYGRMPSLTLNADDDTGRGRWIPTTSVDEYNATLATWFGVSASNLPVVLPNIGRFANPSLGFI